MHTTDREKNLTSTDIKQESFGENKTGMVDDDITLIHIALLLWRKKWWVFLSTTLFTGAGLAYALLAEPQYTAQAIIAPREADRTGAGILSQMGGLGGMFAQMGRGTSLDHIVIIAQSHDLAEVIINKYNLLPYLFHKRYDFEKSEWTVDDSTEIPGIKKGAKRLGKNVVSVSSDLKRNVITIGAEIYDSVLAAEIVNWYLLELGNKLKKDIIDQSRDKKKYLDEQMKSTADPWMLQKLQELAGMEVEKSMVVAGSSISILETPMVPTEKSKPKRKKIVMVAFLGGFLLAAMLITIQAILNKDNGNRR